jgi:hypothetical protein
MLTQLGKSTGQSEVDLLMEPDYPDWYTGDGAGWNYGNRVAKKWRLVVMLCNTNVGHAFEITTSARGNNTSGLEQPTSNEIAYLQRLYSGFEIRIINKNVVSALVRTLTDTHTNAELAALTSSRNP